MHNQRRTLKIAAGLLTAAVALCGPAAARQKRPAGKKAAPKAAAAQKTGAAAAGKPSTPPQVGPAKNFKLPPVEERTLPNGMRVLFIQNAEQPVVSMNVMIRSGAASEPAAKAGLAQMTASLLDQGTESRTATQIAQTIDSAGGGLGVSASWDSTTASTTVLANKAAVAADLLADVLIHPVFKPEEIERARTQTLSGLQLSASDAGNVADEVFEKVVYGASAYAHPIGGTPASVRGITRDDLVAFHKAHFMPNNATLAIVGDMKSADAFALAEKVFGGWQKGQVPPAPQPFKAAANGKVRIIILDKPDAAQTEIRAGLAGFARNDPDYIPAVVTNTILGGPAFSSRLGAELRVKRGLTYGIYSSFDTRLLGGAFSIDTSTKTESTAEAVQVILDQVSTLRGTDVSAEELKQRQNYISGVFLLGLETPEAVAGRLLAAELYGLPKDYLDTYASKVQSVTVADVRRVASGRIRPDEFVIVLAGNAAQFEEQVKKFGAVEKVPFDQVDVSSETLRRAAAAGPGAVSEADRKAGAEMLDRTIAALGGDAFLGLKSLVVKGTGKISPAPGQQYDITSVTSYRVYPDKERNDIALAGFKVGQIVNGDQGWAMEPSGNFRDISDQVKENRLYGLDLLRRFRSGGYTARALPDAQVNGKAVKVFAVADGAGHETTFAVDPATFLPVKVSHPDKQGDEQATYYADYRDVSGLKIAYAVEQWQKGRQFITTTYTDVQANAEVDPKLFEKTPPQ